MAFLAVTCLILVQAVKSWLYRWHALFNRSPRKHGAGKAIFEEPLRISACITLRLHLNDSSVQF